MDRKSASGSGIQDEQPGSYFLELTNTFLGFIEVKIGEADPGCLSRIPDLRSKYSYKREG
jgi:hypothetical protein